MSSSSSSSRSPAAGVVATTERAGRAGGVRWRARLPIIVLAAAFASSRAGYHLMGVRFDTTLLHHSWQLLDPSLLEHDLWRSAWYLHTQPPLFNVFVGLVLQISPFADGATFAWVWFALGGVLAALLYDVARRLDFSPWASTAIAIVIGCGPGVVLYEAWFQYELPVMVLLTATFDAFLRWQHGGRLPALAATATLAAATVLTRSLVHPVWFVLVVVVALSAIPIAEGPVLRRRFAVVAIPVLLVAGAMVKNAVLFDTWQLSSWAGWNLHRIAFDDVDVAERQALVEQGVLSPMAPLYLNQPVDFYDRVLGPCEPSRPDVRALAEPTKVLQPNDPFAVKADNNLNHECYLRVYDAYLDDALRFIVHSPRTYAYSVATAAELWALPTSDYAFVRGNAEAMGPIEAINRRLVLLTVTVEPPARGHNLENQLVCLPLPTGPACLIPGGRYRFSLTVVAATLGAVLLGLRSFWRLGAHGDRDDVHWIVLGGTLGWVTIASILLEIGENHRFRSVVEPLTLLVAALAVRAVAGRAGEVIGSLRSRRSAAPRQPEAAGAGQSTAG